ncbi:MAG: rhomboid family intramembrane serine protease [Breznakibacter sp.]
MVSSELFLIIAISGISIMGFSQPDIIYKLQFNAWQILRKKEYYRLFTHAFVHGGWMHLIVNMFVLWSFGRGVIYLFSAYFNVNPTLLFLLLFATAIPVSSLYSLQKEKNNYHYNAVGASGAVTAVVFASIFLEPYSTIYIYFIPVPGIVFGAVYLVYSKYMSNRGMDNIGHDAHFWGAVYGFFFPLVLDPSLAKLFFYKLLSF